MPGTGQSAVQPHHREPATLSANMTPADLIDVLEHLPFAADRF
jgi:hypothetical protein